VCNLIYFCFGYDWFVAENQLDKFIFETFWGNGKISEKIKMGNLQL